MTTMPINQYQKLIWKATWAFCKRRKIRFRSYEFDEIYSDALYNFVLLSRSVNKDKGLPSAYYYRFIMLYIHKKWKKRKEKNMMTLTDNIKMNLGYEENKSLNQLEKMIGDLGDDVFEVYEYLITNEKFQKKVDQRSQDRLRKRVILHFKKEKGWPKWKILNAFNLLKRGIQHDFKVCADAS